MVSKDRTCEAWLEEIKSRPRPRLLLEYFAANIAKNQSNESEPSNNSTNTKKTTATSSTNASSDANVNNLLMYCRHCTKEGVEGTARAFIATPPPQLIFCTNRLRNKKDMEEVFVHEMLHAVDYCTRNMDLTKCEALACSEIRAAREAECLSEMVLKWNGEKVDAPWPVSSFTKEGCTKRLATAATQAMFPGSVGEECVEKMFKKCYKDMVPFNSS
jgi:hypothetical protein